MPIKDKKILIKDNKKREFYNKLSVLTREYGIRAFIFSGVSDDDYMFATRRPGKDNEKNMIQACLDKILKNLGKDRNDENS